MIFFLFVACAYSQDQIRQKISGRFHFKNNIINQVEVYQNVDACLNGIYIWFQDGSEEKNGILNEESVISEQYEEVDCVEEIKTVVTSETFKIETYGHYVHVFHLPPPPYSTRIALTTTQKASECQCHGPTPTHQSLVQERPLKEKSATWNEFFYHFIDDENDACYLGLIAFLFKAFIIYINRRFILSKLSRLFGLISRKINSTAINESEIFTSGSELNKVSKFHRSQTHVALHEPASLPIHSSIPIQNVSFPNFAPDQTDAQSRQSAQFHDSAPVQNVSSNIKGEQASYVSSSLKQQAPTFPISFSLPQLLPESYKHPIIIMQEETLNEKSLNNSIVKSLTSILNKQKANLKQENEHCNCQINCLAGNCSCLKNQRPCNENCHKLKNHSICQNPFGLSNLSK